MLLLKWKMENRHFSPFQGAAPGVMGTPFIFAHIEVKMERVITIRRNLALMQHADQKLVTRLLVQQLRYGECHHRSAPRPPLGLLPL
jgi:hypothetical protein